MLDYIAAITMNTSLSIFGGIPGQSGIGYDAAGNRGGFTGTLPAYNASDFNFSHVMTYTYDGRDELTEEKSTATSGNTNTLLTGSPYSYLFNTDNQNNSGGFMYDGSGNPTQYNSSASTYAYDPEQRLTGIGGSFTAHYDGDGMRDYTIVNGTTTYYVYDGSSPVLEETYSGSTTTIQVANGMADGWRERYAATSAGFNAYGFDPQGSLTVEDSSFNTTLPAQNVYVYDGYGNRLVGERVSNGSLTAFNIDPVQFGGQYGYYTDTSTGEVQLTHRYYDASTGHFLNRDPIGYNGGQNLYTFCGNNPINESDPEGTSGFGSWWHTHITVPFMRGFFGTIKPGTPTLGGNRSAVGLDPDELSSGGTPQLVQHPAQSAQFVNHGAKAAVGAMALCVVGSLSGPDGEEELELGLGMKESLPNLKRLAPQAKDFNALKLNPYDPAFSDSLLSAMTKAKTIHFDISGMEMLNGANGVITGPLEWNAKGSTNWELRTIMDSPALRNKTIFYRAVKRINYQAILKLP